MARLHLFIKHEKAILCPWCGLLTNEGYSYGEDGELCFRCVVVATLRGFVTLCEEMAEVLKNIENDDGRIPENIANSCCDNEERTMDGGCKNCGGPCF